MIAEPEVGFNPAFAAIGLQHCIKLARHVRQRHADGCFWEMQLDGHLGP